MFLPVGPLEDVFVSLVVGVVGTLDFGVLFVVTRDVVGGVVCGVV